MSKTILKKLILPVVIIVVTAALIIAITENPPSNNRFKKNTSPQMTVQTKTVKPVNYQVMVQSYGTVQPRTQSVLFAQVSGQINHISEQFRAGGFFKKGDVLIQLDDRDHQAEVNIAKASLLSAEQELQEEVARGKQAATDWERLGNGKTANPLVLRQPQLDAAKAKLMSAQAQFDKIKLSLERTKIVAPYSGRILQKNVDIGQVISSNTQLANIYAADTIEIRLPIKNKDLPLITLPEEYQPTNSKDKKTHHSNTSSDSSSNPVVFTSNLMGEQTWLGQIIRTESAIDSVSQQLYVIGQIENPFKQTSQQKAQIKIGQYVKAKITGRRLDNVIVIPSSAVYQGSYVYTVDDGLLVRKEVDLGWQNGTEAIVESGLTTNDELVLTSLGQVSSGTPVAIEGQEKQTSRGNFKGQPQRPNGSPKDQKKRLEKMAAEKGISVDELMERRKKHQAERS